MRRTFAGCVLGLILLSKPMLAVGPGDTATRLVQSNREAAAIYNVMTTLPVSDRKILFRGLSAASKAALWRNHLDAFSVQHQLSPAQAGVIVAAKSLLNEELFATRQSDAAWESQVHVPLQRLEQSARTLFSRDLLSMAFAQIGPPDPDEAGVVSLKTVPRVSALDRRLIASPDQVSECTCSAASDLCWIGSACGGAICWFNDSDWGCGFMWGYHCDSKCTRSE